MSDDKDTTAETPTLNEEKTDVEEAETVQETIEKKIEESPKIEEVVKESQDSEKETTVSPKKRSPKKEPKKNEEKKSENQDEDDEDDSDIEEIAKPGLLDLPAVVEGKRKRQRVERLSLTSPAPVTPKPKIQFKGEGTPLGSIPHIVEKIDRVHSDKLKFLHKFLFGSTCKSTLVKKAIRQFDGFPFDNTTPEYEKKLTQLYKHTLDELKLLKTLFCIKKGVKSKTELVELLVNFMMKPDVELTTVTKPKSKKRKSKGSGEPTAKRAKTTKKTKSKDSVDEEEGDNEDDDNEEDDDEDQNDDDDQNDKESGSGSEGDESDSNEGADGDDDNDDEEKAVEDKKSKKNSKKGEKSSPKKKLKICYDFDPSDNVIENMIRGLLDSLDLREVSMKQMIRSLQDQFPNANLKTRKAFLKEKVKKIIQE